MQHIYMKQLISLQKHGRILFQRCRYNIPLLMKELLSSMAMSKKGKAFFYGFSGLLLLIACPGLFGLPTFVVERKIKEIGIRKVPGASVSGIVGLLSKDFLKLVLISILIASPLAWYFMNNWLQDFAYRINISWWVFIAAGIIALLITLITVSIQSIKQRLQTRYQHYEVNRI